MSVFLYVLGRGRPHSFTPEVPLWWVDLGQQEEDGPSLSSQTLGVGEVVTKAVLRTDSEFMIYYKLLQTQLLRSGVAIPQLTGIPREPAQVQVPRITGLLHYRGDFWSPI